MPPRSPPKRAAPNVRHRDGPGQQTLDAPHPLLRLADALPGPLRPLGRLAASLLADRRYFWHLAGLLLVWEALLTAVVILKVPYTEIDWIAYMQEVEGFLGGERDYMKLKGDTGPLVYPAGFVYLYSGLRWLTGGGVDLRTGQWIFAGLYLATMGVVFAALGHSEVMPNYGLILLTLSKRLHSIYVLRLFNDPWAMFFLYCALLAMVRGRWRGSAVLYSLAVSIKMNVLLFAPAFGVLHLVANGLAESIINGLSFLLIQILLSLPFMLHNARSYLARSFELSRVFLYKWTTNWKFFDEATFLSPSFARLLLLAHAGLLLVLLPLWTSRRPWRSLLSWARPPFPRPSADRILSAMLTSNLAGILCARSLHYQFYSWYAHAVPYLLFFADLERALGFLGSAAGLAAALLRIGAWAVLEWTWNVYPATAVSSAAMVVVNGGVLAACILFGRWTRGKESGQAH
ncbi:ALG3 protein [Hyaloraphidium curvatum]|nr:ALG3 protein [Hyaloraphidium curvatum]